jgi:hypothetical protein
MKRQPFYLVIFFLLGINSFAISVQADHLSDTINDGPYIFRERNKLKVLSVKNGVLTEDLVTQENFDELKNRFNLKFNYEDLTYNYLKKLNYSQSYTSIDSIAIISDIHGEYSIYIKLLKSMGIIDNDLNWKFGKGHLVVLGDIFDRGDMVTEVLWHLFGLEKQAVEAGGMVHVILGNHEAMVLENNLYYLNDKYKVVESITNSRYFDLYAINSVLGNWLRSKPVIVTIDDIIFVHGGISPGLVERNLTITKINQIFSNEIIGKYLMGNSGNESPKSNVINSDNDVNKRFLADKSAVKPSSMSLENSDMMSDTEMEEIVFLVQNDGPLWYRGYFTNPAFSEKNINSILDFYRKKCIVVGHTICDDINSMFDNKILGIDAGIEDQRDGVMLIYKNGSFYKGHIDGTRIKL